MSPAARPKCLVTGGAGFLGRHIVDALSLEEKYDVSIFDVRESGDPSARAIIGDITDPSSIAKACEGLYQPFFSIILLSPYRISDILSEFLIFLLVPHNHS